MRSTWIVILAMVASIAVAGDTKTTPKPKITKADARKTALAKHPGKIKSAELETENGRLIYSFDIQTKEGIYEVGVDANDGSVVEDKMESAADEAKEKAAELAKKKAKAGSKD